LFNAKSKDIRGYNANRLMSMELNRIGKVKDDKQRPKVFNEALRKVAKEIGHGVPTLRKQYLLPEIEQQFYKHGSIGKIKL
jgi:phosphoribosyl-dephospho-CoA transferase